MLDFLEKVDISKKTIKEIEMHNNESMIFNLKTNSQNCAEIIVYFRKLGINNIDELLVYRIEWFLGTLEDTIKNFKNDKDLVFKINEDYMNVDLY